MKYRRIALRDPRGGAEVNLNKGAVEVRAGADLDESSYENVIPPATH